ncbi:helix-turn-helix domain-containing protein, partial [Streptomyces sp. NRRL B-24572]|uniref:helix-turn-helix domain-containing protein n=1 Tax=Streptomyces sp. NRRL B-24572 TaxID=1962156 RepID=UPI001C4E6A65
GWTGPADTHGRRGIPMARGGSNALLSFETIAERMEINKRTVLDNYKSWKIPVVRVSDRIIRVRERDFEAWLDRRTE